ncbi:cytochrome c maturation protein CcmE [Maricaulis maris]|uniref:Cytochrome c-type biogenesis protein CcmE n=1 Tax=Maricaulis maris TaxID=74318 RepID=A0A495D182_9PROT|nr:cytochrome c maturation protein CcmE [Maricaulis maris]RKQ95264.1 cytochrome c-type biogenesis protein CcmE [Maricaulis maris]
MRHRNRRLATIAVAGIVLSIAVALGFLAVGNAIVYFYSPSEIAEAHPGTEARIRVGGLVLEDSVGETADGAVQFVITDRVENVQVVYDGLLPDLFREGQGVVVEGQFNLAGVLQARNVLAKHDETYMPPEVAEALREAGVWQGEGEDMTAGAPDSR